jgi:putative oxidoreductase
MRWRNPWLIRGLAIVLGIVFIYASHDKILKREWTDPGPPPTPRATGPAEFARVIYRYQIVGPNATLQPIVPNVLAVTLPWVELLAGVLLVIGVWRREAALLSALMLAIFIGGVASTMWRGIDIENCGCFSLGTKGRHAGWNLIAGDAALLAAAVIVAAAKPKG